MQLRSIGAQARTKRLHFVLTLVSKFSYAAIVLSFDQMIFLIPR